MKTRTTTPQSALYPQEETVQKTPIPRTKEDIIAAVLQYYKKHGKFPTSNDFKTNNGLPSPGYIKKHFCMTPANWMAQQQSLQTPTKMESIFQETQKRIFAENKAKTEKRARADIITFYKKYRRLPKYNEFKIKNNLPPYKMFPRLFQCTPFQWMMKDEVIKSLIMCNARKCFSNFDDATFLTESRNLVLAFYEQKGRLPSSMEFFKPEILLPPGGALSARTGLKPVKWMAQDEVLSKLVQEERAKHVNRRLERFKEEYLQLYPVNYTSFLKQKSKDVPQIKTICEWLHTRTFNEVLEKLSLPLPPSSNHVSTEITIHLYDDLLR